MPDGDKHFLHDGTACASDFIVEMLLIAALEFVDPPLRHRGRFHRSFGTKFSQGSPAPAEAWSLQAKHMGKRCWSNTRGDASGERSRLPFIDRANAGILDKFLFDVGNQQPVCWKFAMSQQQGLELKILDSGFCANAT